MNITREIKKQKAVELMHKLGIYKPYIQGFEKEDKVCFFECFGGFWVYQEPELDKKIKEFEEEHDSSNNWKLVKVGKNHYCFSAFIKGGTENKYVYISISDVRYFQNDWYKHILVRTAKNETDYKGGFNNYTTLDRLEGKVAAMLNELPF